MYCTYSSSSGSTKQSPIAVGVSESMKTPCVPQGGFYVLYDEAAEAAPFSVLS